MTELDKAKELLRDGAFASEISEAGSPEELEAILKGKDLNLSAEEMEALAAYITDELGLLSDENE